MAVGHTVKEKACGDGLAGVVQLRLFAAALRPASAAA